MLFGGFYASKVKRRCVHPYYPALSRGRACCALHAAMPFINHICICLPAWICTNRIPFPTG